MAYPQWRFADFRLDPNNTLRLGRHLLHLLQNECTGKEVSRLTMPLPSNDALDIYKDKRPPCRHAVWVTGMRLESRVALNNLESGVVAKERIREVKRIREGYLGKRVLSSNPQHLHPPFLERAVINLPG